VTADQLGTLLAYPSGTVVRDASGCVWGKKWQLWQRFGSLGEYAPTALVWPCEVIWNPGGYSGTVEPREVLTVILLGLILLVVGLVAAIHILFVIGIVLLIIGLILFCVGYAGHPVAGRNHWW
jgi:hypothetical protein